MTVFIMNNTALILLTHSHSSVLAWHAVRLAEALIGQHTTVRVFFYQDAVSIANQINWQPDDESSLAQAWLRLDIDLPVCVTAALSRGVVDDENAQRHHLPHANLLPGFRLTGLGELATAMIECQRTIQL